MNERAKITASHLSRQAIVYLRQSSAAQVEHNRESTDRQYALAAKARELGWPNDRIIVIDEDLGLSGSGFVARSGFARLTAEVALAHVGLVLGLEVSRLARNNADWHRLIDLGGLTDTLIGDADGIYHPALFNDRLLLGLKGTMSEAELHVLRARLNGGIRNKAARGELRRGLPVGFVWGEAEGEVLLHPDEAVVTAIRTIFARFAETGSARRVWLWFRDQGLQLPLQMSAHAESRWVEASYHAIHQVLSNPVYALITAVATRRLDITVPASISSRGAAAIASTLVACRSTTLWHAPSLQRSSRRRSPRRWLLPSSWRWIARPRSSTGGSASSGRAMRQALPSAGIAPSILTTGSSRVASSVRGRRASMCSSRRRRSSHVARMSARACSRARSAAVSPHLVPISRRSGRRPRPRRATERRCAAP